MFKKIISIMLMAITLPVLSAAEGTVKEWSHSLGLGYNRAKGNTDTELFTANYTAEKKKEDSKLKLGVDAQVGRENSQQTANNYDLYSQYNKNFSPKNYWYIKGNYEIDKIADLDSRITIGPGLGRSVLKKKKIEMDFEAGLSYVSEDYKGIDGEDSTAVRFAEIFKYKISQTAELWQNAEYLGTTDDTDKFLFQAQLGVSSSLTTNLNFKSYIENKHNSRPPLGKTRNDTSFVTMIVLSL